MLLLQNDLYIGKVTEKNDKSPLRSRVKDLADKPGVYLMKNRAGKIIYIGKARSIGKRVRSYFSGSKDIKTRILMQNAADIETIITRNEYEALILENNLIKQWKPRFNINLKDGKSYPAIRITNEEFPRIFRTRRIIFDGSDYFGPFPHAAQLDYYLNLIEKLFPLRKCRGPLKKRKYPCLYYHIGRCPAPCCGNIDTDEYNLQVDRIKKLLSGQTKELRKSLAAQMESAAESRLFEQAAVLRDQINVIKEFSEGQHVMDHIRLSRDYLGYSTDDNLCSFVVLQMRNGSLVGKKQFRTEIYSDDEEALNQFIIQYYSNTQNPPSNLYLPESTEVNNLSSYLSEILDSKIRILIPQRGRHRKLIAMAEENAREDILERSKEKEYRGNLEKLKTALEIKKLPRRIEGFDIAHLSGQDSVGSMVSFFDGRPEKSSYRIFKLRTLKGKIDDYEAMREIIARRYTRVLNENLKKPDLILVDGGKGQVRAAAEILDSLGLSDIPLAGLAKVNEEIFLRQSDWPILLEEGAPALRVLQYVRNESHRFATGFHKKLRAKRLDKLMLEDIKGIGKKRSRTLLRVFGSLEEIMKSSPEDLVKQAGIPMSASGVLIRHLKEKFETEGRLPPTG